MLDTSFNHPFVRWFVGSFVGSLVRAFVGPFVHYILFLSHTGRIYGYSAEYDAIIDTTINRTFALSNVSTILRKYNTSQNINLFNQGKMF